MALQIDASTPAPLSALFPASTQTTASFTPPARSILVVLIAATTNLVDTDFHTVNGGGLTWTRRLHKSPNSASTGGASPVPSSAEIWTAFATTSPGSMTVSVVPSADVIAFEAAIIVLTGSEGSRLTGQEAAGISPFDPGFGTPLPVAFGGTTTGSHIFAVAVDQDEFGTATFQAGYTAIVNTSFAHIWRTTSTISAATLDIHMTGPDSQTGNMCAIEVKEARGGGGPSAWLS